MQVQNNFRKLNKVLTVALFALLCNDTFAQRACPRIVSQASYITETLTWLGKAHCIVGVSSYDTRKDLPQTGDLMKPDYKAIAALHPDVLFLPVFGGSSNIDIREIKSQNPSINDVKIVQVGGMGSVDQIVDEIYIVASSIGMPDAQVQKEKFEALLHAKFSALKKISRSSGRVAVLTHCFGHPAIIGRNTFINDALNRSGFAVTPMEDTLVISTDDETSPGALAEQLRNYWDKNNVSTVILISDMLRPSCILSGQHRLIPFLVVGLDTFHSPSPRLLDDLDILGRVIELNEERKQ